MDNMNGRKICEKVNLLLSFRGERVQKITGIRNKSLRCLERARMLLFDMHVDFVELRSERCTESSGRSVVPGVKYEVDASLRDFTINSLFYNVNTTSV